MLIKHTSAGFYDSVVHSEVVSTSGDMIGSRLQIQNACSCGSFRKVVAAYSISSIETNSSVTTSPLYVSIQEHHVRLKAISSQDSLESVHLKQLMQKGKKWTHIIGFHPRFVLEG